MKKFLFVLALGFVIFLTGTKPVLAQTPSVEISAGTTIDDALKALAICSNFLGKVIYEEGAQIQAQRLVVPVSIKNCRNLEDLKGGLQHILPALYVPSFDLEGNLHIKRDIPPPLAPSAAELFPTQPAARPGISFPTAPTPTAPMSQSAGRCGWGSRMEYAPLAVQQYASLLPQATIDAMSCEHMLYVAVPPVFLPTANWGMQNNYPVGFGGAYNAGYYGYGGYGWKGCLTGPSGYVKFEYDGKDGDRKLWLVSFNGEVIGTINQSDSIFNRWIRTCAGPTQVTVEKLHEGKWEKNFSIRPGDYTKIPVGDFLFPKPTP